MKKRIIALLVIMSSFNLQANEIKNMGDKNLIDTVNESLFVNKNIITIDDIEEIEKIISEKIMNFDNIKINSLLVKDFKKNNLNILKVRNIEIEIEKINIKFNNYKKGIEIQLNQYSVLFEVLYSLASMKIEYFTDA